jgi:type II secretory pathway component PulF
MMLAVFVIAMLAGLAWLVFVTLHLAEARQFSRQESTALSLALALRTGLPLHAGVLGVAQTYRGRYRRDLERLALHLESGASLAAATARVPGSLPPDFRTLLSVAAESPDLANRLESTVLTQREIRRSRGVLLSTLIYVTAIFITTISSMLFIAVFIMPKYKAIAADFGVELPFVTRLVFAAFESPFLLMPLTICGAAGAALLIVELFQLVLWLFGVDRRPMGYVSRWLLGEESSMSLRVLAAAMSGGRSLEQFLDRLELQPDLSRSMRRICRARDRLEEGASWSTAIQAARIVSSAEARLIDTAVAAGNGPEVINGLADRRQRLNVHRLELFLRGLRPTLVILVSVPVGTFVVGSFAPVIKVIHDIGR